MVFAVCLFTACSDDDPKGGEGDNGKVIEALVGTWNVEESVENADGSVDGSVKIKWDVPAGTAINIDLFGTGQPMPMDINETIVPLANSMANAFLPKLLKSVTFGKDGSITAVYKDADDMDDASAKWQEAKGYVSYKVVDDTHINILLNADKILSDVDVDDAEDAAEKEMMKKLLDQFGSGIPVNIRWNADKSKAYFFVDKAYIQPMIVTLNDFIQKIPTTNFDEDDLKTLKMLKSVVEQLPEIMNKTTAFEAGLELEKQN